MKFVLGVDDKQFYWNPATLQVLLDEGNYWRVIGYADDTEEAEDVILSWL